jgi:glycosyltransferase involved in cell wall biosynthesis
MKIIFLTLLDIGDVNERGIYHDLLRKFRDEEHEVYVIYPSERRKKMNTSVRTQSGVTLLNIRTLNIQKTNIVEKGVGTLLLEYQFLNGFKNYFSSIKFDLVLYSTPPITLSKVVRHIKEESGAISYLLLKDIFPQNAVDLGMIKQNGMLHRMFAKKEKELYNISDFIGCMSPANVHYILQHHQDLSPSKVEVNPNSISPVDVEISQEEKKATRNKFDIPQDAIAFIYGGNLGKPQGIDFLVQVLDCNKKRTDIFFVVVGSGTEFPTINAWYKEQQPANTLLLESLPKGQYEELLSACDVGLIFLDKRFTIPNFPSRLLSYLQHKMPVLAATDASTDIGTVITEAGCGFWCESGDIASFDIHLEEFVSNRGLIKRMGESAQHLLTSSYSIDISYATIMEKCKRQFQQHRQCQ